MRLDEIQTGDILTYWHEEYSSQGGGRGLSVICYAKVIAKTKKQVKVEFERGAMKWKPLSFFHGKTALANVIEECPQWAPKEA